MSPVNTQKTEPQIVQPLTSFEKWNELKEFNQIMKPLIDQGVDVSGAQYNLVEYNSSETGGSEAKPKVGDKEVAAAMRNAFQTNENQQDLQQIGANLAYIRQAVGMAITDSGQLTDRFKPSFTTTIRPLNSGAAMSNAEQVLGGDRSISYIQELKVHKPFMDRYSQSISDGRYTPQMLKNGTYDGDPATVLQNELGEFDISTSILRSIVDDLKKADKLDLNNLNLATKAADTFLRLPELQLATMSATDTMEQIQGDYITANPQSGSWIDAKDREKLREKLVSQMPTPELVKMLNDNLVKSGATKSNYIKAGFNLDTFSLDNPNVSQVAPGILYNKELNLHFPANAKELYQTEMQEELKEMFPHHNIKISFKDEVSEKDGRPYKFSMPVFSEEKK